MSLYDERGPVVRVIYLLIALAWTAMRRLRGTGSTAGGAVILCYHGVSDRQRRRFAWQMAQVAGRAVDPAALDAPARAGLAPCVCVTFDDAFANLLDNALPVMRQLEIPATIFAVAGNLGAPPRWPMPPDHPERVERIMSAAELGRIRGPLCRIGSHTLSHPDLTSLSPPRLREELTRSQAQLEQIVRHDVEDLALPFGACDRHVLTAARAAGYRRVFTLEAALEPLAPGVLGRFSMTPDAWRIEFRLTCAGGYAWLRTWRQWLRRCRDAARPHEESALT